MADDNNKKQRVDPPSAWCSPVTASTHPIAPQWTYTPAPFQQSTSAPPSLPPFSMPPMRPNSPPRFFFPADVSGDRDPTPPLEHPSPPREEKYMKFRDPRFPLAGLMREDGGVFDWMRKNR